MINTSKKEKFSQETGHYSLIQSSKISKEKIKLTGLGLMRLKMFLIMEQSKIGILMKKKVPLLVNGHRHGIYHKPMIKEEFVNIFQDNSYLKLVKKNSSSSQP